MKTKRTLYRRTIIAIAALAILLRLVHVFTLNYSPVSDMTTYWTMSDALMFTEPTQRVLDLTAMGCAPAYPVLLGVTRKMFGAWNHRPLLYFQALVDGLAVLLLASVARRLYGARIALIAALLFASYKTAVLNTGVLMTESLTVDCCLLAIWVFFWFMKKPSLLRAVSVGFVVALAGHLRTNVMTLIGVFCLYRMLAHWRCSAHAPRAGMWRALRECAVMVATLLLLLVPWSIRNSIVLKQWVPFVMNTPKVMLEGNNPFSNGDPIDLATFPNSWKDQYQPPDGMAAGPALKACGRLATRFMFETHPDFTFFTLFPRKIWILLTDREFHPWSQLSGGTPADYPLGPRLRYPFVDYLWIAVPGLLGMLLPGRRFRWFAATMWLALFVPLIIAVAAGRYRYPSELAMILGASVLLGRLFFQDNFTRRFRAVVSAALGLALAMTVVAFLRFSGPSVLDKPVLLNKWPVLKQMVSGIYTFTKPYKSSKMTQTVPICRIPVDPGRCSHLAFSFQAWLRRPPEMRSDSSSWGNAWPSIQMRCMFYDDAGKPVPDGVWSPRFQYATLSNFQEGWHTNWRIVALPGQATSMGLAMEVGNAGTVEIRSLQARGPVWYR